MLKKSILVLMACFLFLFTYLSFNTEPQITILKVFGYSVGINVTDYWYLKISYFILFYLLLTYSNRQGNGN